MVLGNMITNKSYDKRYDVPLSISCKRFCSLHTSLGRKRTVTSVELIYLYLKLQVFTEVSEGEVKIWVFFLLNKTSVLYVEYKMILFAWSFCMNIYFIFFFQMNCAILLSCIINLIIINLIFLYTTAEIGALSLSVVCATCLHVWL